MSTFAVLILFNDYARWCLLYRFTPLHHVFHIHGCILITVIVVIMGDFAFVVGDKGIVVKCVLWLVWLLFNLIQFVMLLLFWILLHDIGAVIIIVVDVICMWLFQWWSCLIPQIRNKWSCKRYYSGYIVWMRDIGDLESMRWFTSGLFWVHDELNEFLMNYDENHMHWSNVVSNYQNIYNTLI